MRAQSKCYSAYWTHPIPDYSLVDKVPFYINKKVLKMGHGIAGGEGRVEQCISVVSDNGRYKR